MPVQYSPCELSVIYEKLIFIFKKNKVKSVIFYILFIVYFSLPSFQIPVLEYNSFRVTSLMEQRALEEKLIFYPKQSWIDIDKVAHVLLKAIISMEDGNFFNHKGIDWRELGKSLKINERRGKTVRGASTITMQLAKNLYFTTGRNFLRKAKELLIAFRMEKEISKKAVLENYVNAIEWGDGIFGIKTASEFYFNKNPEQLNINEASRLAAVIPAPLRYEPDKNSRYVIRRSSIIRGRLNDVILFP